MARARMNHSEVAGILLAGIGFLGGPCFLCANINLEWRPATPTAFVGETADIGLYAVADADTENFSSMNVIFSWEPTFLQFQGRDTTGAVPLLYSGFPTILHYGLNETIPPQDGDGLYQAQAFLGQPIFPTTAGVLVTTFRFLALAPTEGTLVEILPTGGTGGQTIVYDGTIPNHNVTGTLGSATVELTGGDCNLDQLVDLTDYVTFESCLAGPEAGLGPGCGCVDFDRDEDVDLVDFAAFQRAFTG